MGTLSRWLQKGKKPMVNRVKGYASSYSVEILISYNPELQLKDIESAIKRKLIELLPQLKSFKFVTALVLVFKRIESEDKTKHDTFIHTQK